MPYRNRGKGKEKVRVVDLVKLSEKEKVEKGEKVKVKDLEFLPCVSGTSHP